MRVLVAVQVHRRCSGISNRGDAFVRHHFLDQLEGIAVFVRNALRGNEPLYTLYCFVSYTAGQSSRWAMFVASALGIGRRLVDAGSFQGERIHKCDVSAAVINDAWMIRHCRVQILARDRMLGLTVVV